MIIEEIKCKDVISHICENIGEEINSPKCIAIKEHLDNCADCTCYKNSVEKVIELYKDYKVELPTDAQDKLLKFLELE